MSQNPSAQRGCAVSDERIRNTLRRHIDKAINVDRTFTRAVLAADSGVSVHCIDAIISRDPAKQRRVAMEDGFSLAKTLGDEAVDALLALIGYVGRRVDEPDALQPMMVVASAMSHLSVIGMAAADGRIDHTEQIGRAHV